MRALPTYYKALCSILLVIILFSCKNSRKEINKFFGEKMGVDTVTRVESYLSQGGKMKAKLLANIMYRYQYIQGKQPYMEFPDSIYVEFYNDTTGIDTKVTASYAKYLETEQKIFLRDSVVIINTKNKDTIHCLDVLWDQNLQTFSSEKAIRWDSPVQHIRGTGFNAKQDLTSFNIKKIAGPIYTSGSL
jgi:LPS export ABC transporter protein LptC